MVATASVPAQAIKETTEIKEQESLQLTRNLLRIAIFNISYIRGLFPEKFFHDTSLSALGMRIKKLLPMDLEARRLIDWMEKGVYDALQKKYLKTLLFSLCEGEDGPLIEEYTFSFSYSDSSDEVSMHVDRDGRQGRSFKAKSTSHLTQSQMKTSACRMIRTLVQLMQTLNCVPDERTIIMKLYYYDDVTPVNYEPPFFRCCTYEQSKSWSQTPLRMKVGDVDSKYFAIALKVKSVLDPCEDENDEIKDGKDQVMKDRADDLSDYATTCDRSSGSGSDTESENSDDATHQDKNKRPDVNDPETGDYTSKLENTACEDAQLLAEDENTEDTTLEEENLGRVKEWVFSLAKDTIDMSDVLAHFPDISVVHTEELISCMVKEGLLFVIGKDLFQINKFEKMKHGFEQLSTGNQHESINNDGDSYQHIANPSDLNEDEQKIYTKALYYVLSLEHVTITQLQSKLGNEVNQAMARKLLEKMAKDRFIEERPTSRRIGRRVIHSDKTKKKLQELELLLKPQSDTVAAPEDNRAPQEHLNPVTPAIGAARRTVKKTPLTAENMDISTFGGVHSVGSDLTRYGSSGQKTIGSAPTAGPKIDMTKRTFSRESQTLGKEPPFSAPEKATRKGALEEFPDSQDSSFVGEQRRMRKASMVKEPIFQSLKRIRT